MRVKEARELAFFFFELIGKEPTQQEIAVTINQSKNLLSRYDLEDLKEGISYYVLERPPYGGLRSIGYMFSAMEAFLDEKYYRMLKEKEIGPRGDAVERVPKNRQSRVGEAYNFDMFKRPGED